ncbi:unnamed protein product, partial [Oppiella nova]
SVGSEPHNSSLIIKLMKNNSSREIKSCKVSVRSTSSHKININTKHVIEAYQSHNLDSRNTITITELNDKRRVNIDFNGLGDDMYLVITAYKGQLQLEPNTEAYKLWKDIPLPIYQKFYFFNVTNGADIERLGSKPVLVEMGPYVYRSKWTKTHLVYHDNGTVSYREKKTYHFVPQMSAGSDADVITSLNGPLAVTLSLLQNAPTAVRIVVGLALDAVTEGFFIKRSVKQLLFEGYPDVLTTFGPMLNPKIPSNNNGRFGWLYNRNDTDEGMFTVHTGRDGMDQLNLIDNYKGQSHLDHWRNNSLCNSLADTTNAQMFPPIGDTSKSLYLFHPDFCRRWKLNFKTEHVKKGVTVYRYVPDDSLFKNADDYPPNACYVSRLPAAPNPSILGIGRSQTNFSKQRKIRFVSGVFDMSACKYGAPVLMSYPHFLNGDPIYTRGVSGLKPDPRKHSFYLDVEPHTGTSMGSAGRIQINVFINKPPGLFRYRNVPEIVFPVFWQELGVNVSADMSQRIQWVLKQPTLISSISSTSMLFIGFVLVLTSLLFPFYNNYLKHTAKKESGSVVYTDKSTANSQVDINKIMTTDPNAPPLENGIDNKALDAN